MYAFIKKNLHKTGKKNLVNTSAYQQYSTKEDLSLKSLIF